jgi:hypothetical protein
MKLAQQKLTIFDRRFNLVDSSGGVSNISIVSVVVPARRHIDALNIAHDVHVRRLWQKVLETRPSAIPQDIPPRWSDEYV